jgi:hypothetical protein
VQCISPVSCWRSEDIFKGMLLGSWLLIGIILHKLYPTVPDGRPEITEVSGVGRGVWGVSPMSGIPLYQLLENPRETAASSGGRVVTGLRGKIRERLRLVLVGE